jgi:hypothetical protein
MNDARLRADCARCCGLCCVAPAFDADQGFGFDKPAHTACPNLGTDHRCAIHATMLAAGFPACAVFDCFGAGQWVTQQLFAGQSWQTSPGIAAEMFKLYPKYRTLHELMALLDMAIRRVPQIDAVPLLQCLHEIERICQAGAALPDAHGMSALRQEVQRLLVKCVV